MISRKHVLQFTTIILLITSAACQGEPIDQGMENQPNYAFDAHEHRKGEGYGFWNQQKYRNNPISSMITRDDRPGRGMNGFADSSPQSMYSRDHTHPYQNKRWDKDMMERDMDAQFNDERAIHSIENRIEEAVQTLDPLAGVAIIESGENCFVGVRSKENLTKTQIEKKLNQINSQRHIYVFTEEKTVQKLSVMKEDLNKGTSVHVHDEELQSLKGKN
ncbi:YhcN/YlaJ family sporulation lipoprotein [Alteribacter aurantiacus]|uniref:YhcN/YlaJ family sporulation lipoprotein n=1 Tax=Alteribacter aurantiacus TaxID=254410 RepID=UPI00041E6616|nr:YhcN/YlaJ family sporulation lipoprotein [Alteribacter aurantiacus]